MRVFSESSIASCFYEPCWFVEYSAMLEAYYNRHGVKLRPAKHPASLKPHHERAARNRARKPANELSVQSPVACKRIFKFMNVGRRMLSCKSSRITLWREAWRKRGLSNFCLINLLATRRLVAYLLGQALNWARLCASLRLAYDKWFRGTLAASCRPNKA